MGHFYNPPLPPSQGPVNSTLPIPHGPIPAQGNQPPCRQVAVAMMMVTVLAAWPADLEPRLQAPNNLRQKIAPLTLTYGAQPKPQPFLTTVELHQLIASWPPDAPLPPRGQQRSWMPSVVTAVPSRPLGQINQLVGTWPLDLEPPLSAPNNVQQKIAPLTLTYGAQPRPQPFLTTVEVQQLVASWAPDPPLPPRGQQTSWFPTPVSYVPPAPTGQIYPAILQGVQPLEPLPVQLARSVVVSLPEGQAPIAQPPIAPTALAAYWPADLEPRLGRPNDQQQKIAPLTLTYGSQPPPQSPLTAAEWTAIQATAPESWPAQRAPRSTAWNTPPGYVQPTRFPDAIYVANQAPDPPPVQRLKSVVPTFPAVSQPPVRGPHSPMLAVVAAWADPPIMPRAVPSAAVASLVPYVPPARFPEAIYAAAQPPPPLPVPRLKSVVVTFPAVSQPPLRGPHSPMMTIVASWAPAPIMPRAVPSAAWVIGGPPAIAEVLIDCLAPDWVLEADAADYVVDVPPDDTVGDV